jgi:hypothetical protein
MFFSFCINSYSQNYQRQKNEILLYNVLLNSGIGTIGFVLKNKKISKNNFLKSFIFSSIGGLIKHQSKYNIYYIVNNKPLLSYLNSSFYFIGDSFVRNSIDCNFKFNNWNFEYYGLRINLKLNNTKISFRYSPYSLLGLVGYSLAGNKLNLNKSIRYGCFYFDQNKKYNEEIYGSNFYNSISINTEKTLISTIPHELIHSFQHFDYLPLTKFYINDNNISKSRFFKGYQKIFTTDVNHFYPLYFAAGLISKSYYSNFFELEAEHYGTHKYVIK